MTDERRHFKRVPFDQDVLVKTGTLLRRCQLLDISLKGALVSGDFAEHPLALGSHCDLHMELSGVEYTIDASTVVRFIKDDQVGLQFQELNLDSLTHLRRLVELNIGDPEEVRRELFFIVDPQGLQE